MTLIANDLLSFPGLWRCRYWYPDTAHNNIEAISEYQVHIKRQGAAYVLQSLKGKGEAPGSHIEARFTVDGDLVTGTFLEDTAPEGQWKGMTYKGAFQLLLSEDHTRMEGMWVAAGFNNGNPKEFTGPWEIVSLETK